MQQKGNTHQSVERALRILKVFLPNNREMRATEIGEKVELHRSTVARLLQILVKHEFVQLNQSSKKYSLGKFAAEAGKAISFSLDSNIVAVSTPHIDALRNTLQEGVSLEIFSGNSTTLAYRAKCPRLVQVSFRIGDSLPVHVAAGAKAILAFLPADVVDGIVPKKLTRFTANTITKRKMLFKQFEEIRESGLAYDFGERDIDVHALAAPVFDHENKPVAALVITVPVSRKEALTDPKTIKSLQETTAAISARLLH